jgi:hypothetical protein
VIERSLRTVAIVLSLIVGLGFCFFAIDEFDRASNTQRERLAGYERPDPTAMGEREREKRHSSFREYIDDANDVLLKPFAGIVSDTSGRWTQRGVPTVLGLLLYGFVLAYLARYAKGRG